MDTRAIEIALASYQGESVRELEQMRRKSLRRYMPLMSTMRREEQLLPLNAPINVKPQGGGGRATHGKLTERAFPWVGILTFKHLGSGI